MTNDANRTNLVTLPKDVAETIEYLREHGWSESHLMHIGEFISVEKHNKELHVDHRGYVLSEYLSEDFEQNVPKYMSAIVNGYDVESTPEEKVIEYYESIAGEHSPLKAVRDTLTILGINIPGVNAPENYDFDDEPCEAPF